MDCGVCVRSLPGEEEVKISFYHNGKRLDLNRKKDDILEKTLQRISIKLQPKTKKKKKENKEDISNNEILCCVFDENNIEVNTQLSNEEGFVNGNTLQIDDKSYTFHVNPPMVSKLVIPTYIMASFPLMPNIEFELGSIEHSKFSWFKSSAPENKDGEWKTVGEGFSYVPDASDIDFYLKCLCFPATEITSGPFFQEVISDETVKAGPGVCLFDERHLYTPSFLPETSAGFRFVTYNILANVFADTDYARTTLFPFCPPYAIKSDYRRQLLFKELIGYHADLICLQECSLHEYKHYLYNWMISNGYHGFLKLKLTEMSEGEALFFRKERYAHVKDLSVSIRDALLLPCNEHLLEKLHCIPALLENIQKKTAVGQVHIIKEKFNGERVLCILNTHLYYKRYSAIVRLLQMIVLTNYVHDAVKEYGENINFIIAGDLNSLRGEASLAYLLGETVAHDNPVWTSCENPEDNGLCMDIKCPIQLKLLSGFPDFTSYVPHCKATLDYIFGDCGLVKDAFLPLPSANEIDVYTGIPCIVYPSDHLAVVLDLKWK